MKYRKLRIAWSVGWGVAAVLLIVLWVRSYWYWEVAAWKVMPLKSLEMRSVSGQLIVLLTTSPFIRDGSFIVSGELDATYTPVRSPGRPLWRMPFNRTWSSTGSGIIVPYWSVALLALGLSAAAFVRRRFSLLSLIIVMSVVALILGFIMALRQ